jgi:hypothetical protein
LIAKGKATTGGATKSGAADRVTSKTSGGGLTPDDDDPPHVTAALTRLDKLAEMIEQRQFAEYARDSSDFQTTILLRNGWADESKHDAIQARLNELDAQAYPAFGGRLVVVGDGARVLKADEDAIEAATEMVTACNDAARMSTTGQGEASDKLTKAVAGYEKAMARVKKLDVTAFRYLGGTKNGSIDVPTALMKCEVGLAATATQFGDEYVPEPSVETTTRAGCGKIEWLAGGVQIGSGQFAPYTRTVGGNSFVEEMPCNKLPKANRMPAALRDAAMAFAEHVEVPLSKLVIVTDGKPYTEVNDEDLHVYRYQKLLAYSKVFQFRKNPCGDEKTFCEIGGSQGAAAYNRLEHYLDRAAAHRGGAPDRCKDHLKQAKERAEWFNNMHAEMVKSGKWITGATYKTKKGAKLKEKDFIASFAEKGKLADDRLLEKWCSKSAAKK